jgi:hypothetical protein
VIMKPLAHIVPVMVPPPAHGGKLALKNSHRVQLRWHAQCRFSTIARLCEHCSFSGTGSQWLTAVGCDQESHNTRVLTLLPCGPHHGASPQRMQAYTSIAR